MPDSSTSAHAGEGPAEDLSPASDSPVLSALASCLNTWQHANSWGGIIEALAPVEAAAVQAGHLALHDVCVILHRRIVQLAETQASPDEEQCAVLATWPSFASAWVEVPGEPQLGELLVEFLQHPMWPRALADDEAENLRVLLGVESGAYGTASLLEVVIEDVNTDDQADGKADSQPDDGLPGYDGLSGYAKLGSAVGGGGRIVPDVRASTTGGPDDHEADDRGAGMEPEGRRPADGTEPTAELPATAQEVFLLLVGEASQIAATLVDIMPLATSESVDEGKRREALEQFAEQVERFNGAVELLGVDIEDESEKRTVRAQPGDVSLELPDDVDAEMLDDLLKHLPDQTAQLSKSIKATMSDGTSEDLKTAQRVAHSIKSVANTIGVTGIANLTHHLEDVLLALGRHGVTPCRALGELLIRASDCLESMGESLLGLSAPPTDALDTLQSVLDWANTLDREGVSAITGDDMVRVPAPLVDDFLRLVGESNNLTGQIQERLSVTSRAAETLREQYEFVQQLCQEMDALIEGQDQDVAQQRAVAGEAVDALETGRHDTLRTRSRQLVEAAADARVVGRSLEDYLSALTDMLSDQGALNRETRETARKIRTV